MDNYDDDNDNDSSDISSSIDSNSSSDLEDDPNFDIKEECRQISNLESELVSLIYRELEQPTLELPDTDYTPDTTNKLLDIFLSSDGTFEDKEDIMIQIINTCNLPITTDELYSLYDVTKIIPEIMTLLNYNVGTYDVTNKIPKLLGNIGTYFWFQVSIQMNLEETGLTFKTPNTHHHVMFTKIIELNEYYKEFFKFVLTYNKNMFIAFIKLFANKQTFPHRDFCLPPRYAILFVCEFFVITDKKMYVGSNITTQTLLKDYKPATYMKCYGYAYKILLKCYKFNTQNLFIVNIPLHISINNYITKYYGGKSTKSVNGTTQRAIDNIST